MRRNVQRKNFTALEIVGLFFSSIDQNLLSEDRQQLIHEVLNRPLREEAEAVNDVGGEARVGTVAPGGPATRGGMAARGGVASLGNAATHGDAAA